MVLLIILINIIIESSNEVCISFSFSFAIPQIYGGPESILIDNNLLNKRSVVGTKLIKSQLL